MNGTSADTSAMQAIDPLQKEGDRIIQWVQFRGVSDRKKHYSTSTLLPQGLFIKFGTFISRNALSFTSNVA